MDKSDKYMRVLGRMQRLCSMREYCVSDILKKMDRDELAKEEELDMVERLKEDKFLDEGRFATAFARDKRRLSGWGPAKIRFVLRSKGITDDIIEGALREMEPEGGDNTLEKIMLRKYKLLYGESDSEKLRARMLRFGVSRGFPFGEVFEVTSRIIKENENS
jgi:regulatory protein